jgi:lipopolysaccharide export system permease protein
MTLALYLGRRFLRDFIRVLLIIALLIFLVELLETIRRYSGRGASFENSIVLALTHMPVFVSQALPLVIMLSSLTFCVTMARSNEFVISRAAGVSAIRSLQIPVVISIGIGLFATLFFDPLAAKLDQRYDELRDVYTGKTSGETVSVSEAGIWMRQKTDRGHMVISADGANRAGAVLTNVTVLEFDDQGRVSRRINANSAIVAEERWLLSNGRIWNLGREVDNPEKQARSFTLHSIPLSISQEQILEGYPAPETLNLWEIPVFIAAMEKAGFSSINHKVHLQMQIVRPFLFAAMLLVGAIFTFQNARFGNLGVSVMLALLFGFGIYFIQNLSFTLGQAGELPPVMAAWVPPIAAMLLALGMFLHLEDG